MVTDIKITVVIPVFNAEKTIVNCINSIIKQTFKVFEIIIINDGSSDNSVSIIHEYKKNYPNINLRIVNQDNRGPSHSRNTGINISQGNWIAFLDADDQWLDNKIYSQASFIESHPDYVLIGTSKYSEHANNILGFQNITLKQLIFKNYFITSSVIVKKEILKKFNFDENQKYSEDYKLWLQISERYKTCILNNGLVVYADNQNLYKRNSLSNKIWKMEKYELLNYISLYKNGSINFLNTSLALMFSIFKFLRRLILSIIN